MPEPSRAPQLQPESFDRIARDLQALRLDAGPVSYAEIVRRIADQRVQRGVPAAAAIPARSTVYNAFTTGRARMDTELLRDIVIALGATPGEALGGVPGGRRAGPAADWGAAGRGGGGLYGARAGAGRPPPPARSAPRVSVVIVLLAGGVALNLLGLWITAVFKLSVYLDMVGTAIASLVLGPWHGVAVALLSSNLGFVTGDLHTWEFTPVNIAGALIWGYGVRRLRLGASLTRFFSLNLAVALGCSLVAAPIVVAAFGGENGHASVSAVLSLESLGVPMMASVFSANIITSIMDKLLTGFVGLAVFTLLHGRIGVPAAHMPLVEKLAALSAAEARGARGAPPKARTMSGSRPPRAPAAP
ncbi:hypothetical protein ACWGOE_01615 [Leucobacter chromiiresistens]